MRLTNDRGNPDVMSSATYEADEINHTGDKLVPKEVRDALRMTIELSRHHVIAWKIIQEFWNRAEDRHDHKLQERLAALLRGGGSDISLVNQSEMCWSTRNLIIGPRTNNRLFDPGEDLDFEIPFGMSAGRQKHVNAMIKLGGMMKEYHKIYKVGTPLPSSWVDAFKKISAECMHLDDICTFVRTEWTMAVQPEAEWHLAFTKKYEVKKFTQGRWHRGCYSPSAVARHWSPDMKPEECKKKTLELKERTHKSYVRSTANT